MEVQSGSAVATQRFCCSSIHSNAATAPFSEIFDTGVSLFGYRKDIFEAAGLPPAAADPEPYHYVPSTPAPDRSLLTDELRAKINGTAVATITAQLRKRGIDNATIDGVRPTHPGRRILGYAKTLRYVPNREDLFTAFGGGFSLTRTVASIGLPSR